jgi:hypothetical protein
MQLKFPNGEHPDIAFDQGEVTIGSRVQHGVSLAGKGLAPVHASFVADRRGLWLRVPPGTPGVHLNARPVRRLAKLTIGDQICLEQVQLVLGEDSPQRIDPKIPGSTPPPLGEAQRVSAVRVVLRAVSGQHFGRSFTLTEPRVIGRSASCDIRVDDPAIADRHAQFELHGDRVILRALSQNEGTLVNGVPVQDAVLSPGDQISFEQHRFVLEAPGLPLRGQEFAVRGGTVAHTQTFQAVKTAPARPMPDPGKAPEPTGSNDPGALWWLIAAAAVLAAALTALLVYSPKMGA